MKITTTMVQFTSNVDKMTPLWTNHLLLSIPLTEACLHESAYNIIKTAPILLMGVKELLLKDLTSNVSGKYLSSEILCL